MDKYSFYSINHDRIVGLKEDGTVEFATAMPRIFDMKNVAEWRGIAAVSVAARHIVAI